jgi:hypothetical protein
MKFSACHLHLRFLKCCSLYAAIPEVHVLWLMPTLFPNSFAYQIPIWWIQVMHHEGWSNGALIGVHDLELGSPTDQVTLVTELGEQNLGFLQLHASRWLVVCLVSELIVYVESLDDGRVNHVAWCASYVSTLSFLYRLVTAQLWISVLCCFSAYASFSSS